MRRLHRTHTPRLSRSSRLIVAVRRGVAAGLALAVLALPTACGTARQTGAERPVSLATAPQPDTDGPVILPRGDTMGAQGVPLGFPHNALSAVSAAIRWSSLLMPRADTDQVEIFTAVATRDYVQRSEGMIDDGYQPPDLPSGSALFFRPLGTQLLVERPDRAVIALLYASRISAEQSPGVAQIGAVTRELVWVDEDWRLADLRPTTPGVQLPASDTPAAVTAAGWDGFRRG